jgi:hypothetical protein
MGDVPARRRGVLREMRAGRVLSQAGDAMTPQSTPDWLRAVTSARRRIIELHLAKPYLSYTQIAKELGLKSRNSVGSALHHYKREIAEILNAGRKPPVPAHARDPVGCRYILDDEHDGRKHQGVKAPHWRYCQKATVAHRDYCADHLAAMVSKAVEA